MKTIAGKPNHQIQKKAFAVSTGPQKRIGNIAIGLLDHRNDLFTQEKLGFDIDNSPALVAQQEKIQAINNASIQKKEKQTSLPDKLKTGIESLSGIDMRDVRVHRNSPKPAQLNALAYTQGNQIHVAPGQDRHLPHEAWHVVQQKQGRVKPTLHMRGGLSINNDIGLEKEADRMGKGAFQMKSHHTMAFTTNQVNKGIRSQVSLPGAASIQRMIGDAGEANIGRVVHDRDYVMANIQQVVPVAYMPGARWPKDPTIYDLYFYNRTSSGMALGSDPNYWLVEKSKENQYVRDYGNRVGNFIPLRSPVLQGLANGAYVLDQETNSIKPATGGEYEDGKYPFVILANGTLQIANSTWVGHTGLAQGNAVLMAGELKINGGVATYDSCQTGHYYTKPVEEERGIELMKRDYKWIRSLRPKGPFGEEIGTGLLAFGTLMGGTYGHIHTHDEG
jgi:hypothetical protein